MRGKYRFSVEGFSGYRTELRLSVTSLASQSGLSRSTLAKIEKGDEVERLTLLKALDVLRREAIKFNLAHIIRDVSEQIKLLETASKGTENTGTAVFLSQPSVDQALLILFQFIDSKKLDALTRIELKSLLNRLILCTDTVSHKLSLLEGNSLATATRERAGQSARDTK